MKAQISQQNSVYNVYIDSEYTMLLINQKFLIENVSNVIIKKIDILFTIKSISFISYNIYSSQHLY